MAAPARQTGASGPARRVHRAWSSLSPEERLAALAAMLLWASMFLPWYGKSVTEAVRGSLRAASYTLSAFGVFSFVEAAVLLVASSVLALLFARAERRAFHLPGGDGSVILLAGTWTGVLVFYRMLDKPGTTGNAQLTTTIGLQWGIFVAMAAAIGLAYSGTRLRAAHRPEPARANDPTLGSQPGPTGSSAPLPHPEDEPTRVLTTEERTADRRTARLPSSGEGLNEARSRRVSARKPERPPERDPFGDP